MRMLLSGVRNSCDMFARNSDLYLDETGGDFDTMVAHAAEQDRFLLKSALADQTVAETELSLAQRPLLVGVAGQQLQTRTVAGRIHLIHNALLRVDQGREVRQKHP